MNTSSTQLTNDISRRLSPTGSLIVCVGSGVSRAAGVPDWRALIERAEVSAFLASHGESAELLLPHLSVERLRATLRAQIEAAGVKPSPLHRRIARLKPQAIFTTNYDDLIERALLEQGTTPSDVTSILRREDSDRFVPVIKLHGALDVDEDYSAWSPRWHHIASHADAADLSVLQALFSSSVVLAIGYSLESPELASLYERFGGSYSLARNWFILTTDSSPVSRRVWRNRGAQIASVTEAVLLRVLDQLSRRRTSDERPALPSTANRRVYLSHARDEDATDTVRHWLKSAGMIPVSSDMSVGQLDLFDVRVQSAIDSAVAAVVVIGRDRSVDRLWDHDQNIAFEIGYLFARFGNEKVLVVVPVGVAPPVDMPEIRYLFLDARNSSDGRAAIERWVAATGI